MSNRINKEVLGSSDNKIYTMRKELIVCAYDTTVMMKPHVVSGIKAMKEFPRTAENTRMETKFS